MIHVKFDCRNIEYDKTMHNLLCLRGNRNKICPRGHIGKISMDCIEVS